jgi:hypothetical protein
VVLTLQRYAGERAEPDVRSSGSHTRSRPWVIAVSDGITFTDVDGVRWSVSEEGVDDTLAGTSEAQVTWLSFETELEIRRLWTYPDDWRRLTAWQLDALCRRASTVVARFPRRALPRSPSDPSPERRR